MDGDVIYVTVRSFCQGDVSYVTDCSFCKCDVSMSRFVVSVELASFFHAVRRFCWGDVIYVTVWPLCQSDVIWWCWSWSRLSWVISPVIVSKTKVLKFSAEAVKASHGNLFNSDFLFIVYRAVVTTSTCSWSSVILLCLNQNSIVGQNA